MLLHLRVLISPQTWCNMLRKFMAVKAKQRQKVGDTNSLIKTLWSTSWHNCFITFLFFLRDLVIDGESISKPMHLIANQKSELTNFSELSICLILALIIDGFIYKLTLWFSNNKILTKLSSVIFKLLLMVSTVFKSFGNITVVVKVKKKYFVDSSSTLQEHNRLIQFSKL